MKKIVFRCLLLWCIAFWRYQFKLRNSHNNPVDSRAVIENKEKIIDNQIIMKEEVLAQWTFNKLDAIHRAQWDVSIKKSWDDVFIEFWDNFSVANGPDLFVILSDWTRVSEIKNGQSIQLGALVQKKWKQTYKVTSAEWESTKWSISIRCRAFDVYFSIATVQ